MKLNRLLKTVLILLAVLVIAFFFRIDYVLVRPGSVEDLGKLITVEGAREDDTAGTLYMVTVAQQRATIFWAAYGLLHPHIEVQPLGDVIPPGMDPAEYRELLEQMMEESQLMSKFIALQRAGYEVEIVSEGAMVEGFMDNSPSEGKLQKGDIITGIDGAEASTANEVISKVQNRSVGAQVSLSILRDDEPLVVEVTTGPHPDDAELPALGIFIRTLRWDAILPVDVRMETGQIGGPSAGLMFVLEILNQLDVQDITGGRHIAGTGTIDLNENIGRIGGVFQKVIAAENAGAEFFLVPQGNYEEAKSAVRHIKLVPVSTLQEALDFLRSIETSQTDKGCQTIVASLPLAAIARGYYL